MRRRTVLAAPALMLPAAAQAGGPYAPVRTDHGWTQSWFLETFLRLPEDLADAKAAGKRLAVVFDQRGCPYCVEMHTDHLTRPAIADYIRERFAVIQLDLHGSREVQDLDGTTLEERQLARRWRVTFTPTIVFFPDSETTQPGKNGREVEVARMHGLLKPDQFLGIFTFVAEKGYADGTGFPAWWAARNRS
jgi:thioredoxin-related protein